MRQRQPHGRSALAPALRFRALLALSLLCVPASGAWASQAGETLFKVCATCHEIGEGAKHKVGPHLDGIVGRTAGEIEGFKFSEAMRKAGKEGLRWDAAALAAYLEKPRDFIPGNRMSFRGMADAAQRKQLVEWLVARSAASPAQDVTRQTADLAGPSRGFADEVLKLEGDVELGEYLSGDCVTCHQPSGRADGIPSIVGVPRDYFVNAIFAYKTNVRNNEVMKLRVGNLTNAEIAALAAYFESLEPN